MSLSDPVGRDWPGLVSAWRVAERPYRRHLIFDPGAMSPGFLVYLVFTPGSPMTLMSSDLARFAPTVKFSCICGIAVVGQALMT